MKKRIIISLMVLSATIFNAQAQTTSGNQARKSTPKSARTKAVSNSVIDSSSNASAPNDGASGQSGRPVAIPSSSTSQAAATRRISIQSQMHNSNKVKKRAHSNN